VPAFALEAAAFVLEVPMFAPGVPILRIVMPVEPEKRYMMQKIISNAAGSAHAKCRNAVAREPSPDSADRRFRPPRREEVTVPAAWEMSRQDAGLPGPQRFFQRLNPPISRSTPCVHRHFPIKWRNDVKYS